MSSEIFSQFLRELAHDSHPVLSPALVSSDYIALDLSKENKAIETVDVSSSVELEKYINTLVHSNRAKVAFGGYLEERNIYNRSSYFNNSNENERNIHLGLDLWVAAETPVYAPLSGTVHSFKNNTQFGDYGPTIILKHRVDTVTFYTLYGHLSLASIASIRVGQEFKKGQQLATLGDATVNGDYPPHLHFQIIKDLQTYVGDYPGVCSKQELEFYKSNCPDPNLLLQL